MRPAGPPPAAILELGVSPLAQLDVIRAAEDALQRGPRPPESLELEDDDDRVACGLCERDLLAERGSGEVVNPGNADPAVALVDWLPPVICPRCKGTGYDPNPG